MRLEAFRIQNYKRISDTDWVSCRDLTAFVGKNEAGKSAIFRGLSKLNPSDGQKYDGLKEFPRSRYTDEFALQDWPVATGRFSLDKDERDELIEICPLLDNISGIEVTRLYSSTLEISFKPESNIKFPKSKELKEIIDEIIEKAQTLTAPEGKGDILGQMKQGITNELEQAKKQLPQDNNVVPKDRFDQALRIVTMKTNEDWQRQLFDPILSQLRHVIEQYSINETIREAEKWVKDHLPQFVYFEDYNVINSAIFIPTFAQQVASKQNDPRVRTSLCLFKHVGLDITKFANIGRHQPGQPENQDIRRQIDERTILASSASSAMTKKFGDWWDQHRHQFRYQIDGDYFRVWVSDEQDPSWIELEQRSAGMQYFFSFFLIFLVEAEGAHKNSILLLDGPALHLHGTAQSKVVKFLEKLSKDNQTLYSTHSPFMIDVDHLENVRVVSEDENGTTRVSEDVWPRDSDTLFPLQAALGYQLAQSLFISKRQLIVEGITDMWLIKAFDQAFAKRGKPGIRSDVVIIPAAGIRNLLPLASMLIGHKTEVVALLDGDEPARREGEKLHNKLLAKTLFIGDFTNNKNAEIEDIFTEDEYISAMKEAYPGIEIAFDSSEKAIAGVINKIQALFKRKELGKFEKWKPAEILRDRIVDAPENISDNAYNIISKVFEGANILFSKSI
jgi:predicted ATP-dependent endonuclease of OLD family